VNADLNHSRSLSTHTIVEARAGAFRLGFSPLAFGLSVVLSYTFLVDPGWWVLFFRLFGRDVFPVGVSASA
jgi:hypothetical protein